MASVFKCMIQTEYELTQFKRRVNDYLGMKEDYKTANFGSARNVSATNGDVPLPSRDGNVNLGAIGNRQMGKTCQCGARNSLHSKYCEACGCSIGEAAKYAKGYCTH